MESPAVRQAPKEDAQWNSVSWQKWPVTCVHPKVVTWSTNMVCHVQTQNGTALLSVGLDRKQTSRPLPLVTSRTRRKGNPWWRQTGPAS
jgi:uncharacterized protein YqjF (DUF2071 family)